MQEIYISNHGDDAKDGTNPGKAIRSWKRLSKLSTGGKVWVFVEGKATWARVMEESIAANKR